MRDPGLRARAVNMDNEHWMAPPDLGSHKENNKQLSGEERKREKMKDNVHVT